MLSLRYNIYELTAAGLFLLAYGGIRLLNHFVSKPLSYLAVFSAMSIVLNPLIIHIVFYRAGLPYVGRGDEELRSFAAGIVTLLTGIIATIRIRRSHGALRGLPFAIAGITGGSVWIGFWIQFYVRFAWGMAHW